MHTERILFYLSSVFFCGKRFNKTVPAIKINDFAALHNYFQIERTDIILIN